LSLYLSKGLLPEVRMKDKQRAHLASLTETRDILVKQSSALKNTVNNILSARRVNLAKEALSSDKKLAQVPVKAASNRAEKPNTPGGVP